MDTGDRISQSLSAASEAIGAAVSGGARNTRYATQKNMEMSKLTTKRSADSWEFNGSSGARKLLAGVTMDTGDRISHSLSAASEAIGAAVSGGGRNTRYATQKNMEMSKLTTKRSADSWEFSGGGARKLLAGVTMDTGDRISHSLSAASEAIGAAVSSGGRNTRYATQKNMEMSKLTTKRSADSWEFSGGGARKLLAGVTMDTGDRISHSLSAASEAIGAAVSGGGRNTRYATQKNMEMSKLTTKRSADSWEFNGSSGARKLLTGETMETGDRISNSLSAASDAISAAVAGGARNTRYATKKNMEMSKLTTKRSADSWEFSP
ncbi:hypothetical protein OEZ85_002937 [Tetradesmus obliquus]|uniref:Senescence domain-containing protein n=1 Tax=Tetradesmus obliquus TaxID=3088 RepID=A0ABY8TZ27_TETOB|nr:hypothetical protein OEZ85_002937 [Tetradesmus obliquus]